MARRILLLLIATLALGGSFYALRNGKTGKRPVAAITSNILALKLDEPRAEPPHIAAPATVEFSSSTIFRSRIALVLVIGIVLSSAAYFGLGKGSVPARAAVMEQKSPSAASESYGGPGSLKTSESDTDDIRDLARSARPQPPAAPTAAPVETEAPPAPTPAVAAEVETPAPAPHAVIEYPADSIEAILCGLPWNCAEAIAIAACESGRDMAGRLDGNWATNGNHYGLFQISYIHAHRWSDFYENWMDPAKNAQWAYEIYAQQGWYPWSCRWAAY